MLGNEPFDTTQILALRSRRRIKAGVLVVGLSLLLVVFWHKNSSLVSLWSLVNTSSTGYVRYRNATWDARADEVKKAFKLSYAQYQKVAFPNDELKPLSNTSQNNFNGWGVTAVDSIDTMILMDLGNEYEEVRAHVTNLDFTSAEGRNIPFFETIIRYLGGLLSAYSLTQDRIFLTAADDLAKALLPAFDTPSHLPAFAVDLTHSSASAHSDHPEKLNLAEIGSFQLEYKYLAHLTQRVSYFTKAEFVTNHLKTYQQPSGMWPIWWKAKTGIPEKEIFTMGSMADSTYEYLLKGWLMSGRTETHLLNMHMEAMRAAIAQLVYLSPTRHLMYMTRTFSGDPDGTMQHLTCFFPGLLALSNYLLPDSVYMPGEKQVFEYVAEGLANTCYILYADSLTGLGPEEVQFQPYKGVDDYESGRWIHHLQKWERRTSRKSIKPPGLQTPVPRRRGKADSRPKDYKYTYRHWRCRPEVIESMYLMWRTTGNPIWRERAWEMFQAIEKNAKFHEAYAIVLNVDSPVAMHADEQPSYFFAETLKYLYLTFLEEDPWPLDKFVFNTEAHPLPVFDWSVSEKARFGMTQ